MKKIYLALVATLFTPVSLFAQDSAQVTASWAAHQEPVTYDWTAEVVSGSGADTFAAFTLAVQDTPQAFDFCVSATDSVGNQSGQACEPFVVPALSNDTTPPAVPMGLTVTVDTAVTEPPPDTMTGGLAELPRAEPDTAFPAITGNTIRVGQGESLSAAVSAAQRGDLVLVEPGATFNETVTLGEKPGTGWVVVMSDGALPDRRVTPADANAMARIIAPGSEAGIRTSGVASHYRIVGLEVVADGVTTNFGLVRLGTGGESTVDAQPHHIVLDRVYVHNDFSTSQNVQRCVTLNARDLVVMRSHLECAAKGFDSQAIVGWNGQGPFGIYDNYLAGSGENIMFGGADPRVQGLRPSDITIRGNHLHKPLDWDGVWTVRYILELKNAQRVLIEGNVLENNWTHAGTGTAIVIKSENQSGGAPWSSSQDVTFRFNRTINVNEYVRLTAGGSGHPNDEPTQRITFEHNVTEQLSGWYYGLFRAHRDVVIQRNTSTGFAHSIVAEGSPATGLVYSDNIAGWRIIGAGTANGHGTIDRYFPDAIITGNCFLRGGGSGSAYPEGNIASVPEDEALTPDLRPGPGCDPVLPVGADMDAVESATAGVR